MPKWKPDAGEILLARESGSFATGAMTQVSGMRWFRDTARMDIQHEFPGWPDGPTFIARPKPERRRARGAGIFGLKLIGILILGVLEALAGSGSAGSPGARPRPPQDEPNEVEDFPVIWAAPGTMARSLPWQLDPERRSNGYRTHLIVTDRRLLVVGFPDDDPKQDEVLWEADRSFISHVKRMRCSGVGGDARVHFTDGSWCRLAPDDALPKWTVLTHLVHPLELVADDELTGRQRKYVEKCLASEAQYDTVVGHVITRRPSGKFLIEIETEPNSEIEPYGVFKRCKFMSKRGWPGGYTPADL